MPFAILDDRTMPTMGTVALFAHTVGDGGDSSPGLIAVDLKSATETRGDYSRLTRAVIVCVISTADFRWLAECIFTVIVGFVASIRRDLAITSNPVGVVSKRGDGTGRSRVVIVAVKPASDSGGADRLPKCWTRESQNENADHLAHDSPP